MHMEAKSEWQKSCSVRTLHTVPSLRSPRTHPPDWPPFSLGLIYRPQLTEGGGYCLMLWHISGLVINSSFVCPSFHPAKWIMTLSLVQGIFYKLSIYWAFKHIDFFIHSDVKCLLCKVDTNDSWLMEYYVKICKLIFYN